MLPVSANQSLSSFGMRLKRSQGRCRDEAMEESQIVRLLSANRSLSLSRMRPRRSQRRGQEEAKEEAEEEAEEY